MVPFFLTALHKEINHIMNALIKKFKALWSEVQYTDAAGVKQVKYWLTGDIKSQDVQAFEKFNGESIELNGSVFILTVRQAGTMYTSKQGLQLPRKSNSVELRPDTRKYVDLGAML